MRKNNVLLAAAMAATLVVPISSSFAALENYMGCGTSGTTSCNTGAITAYSIIPMMTSDNGGVWYGTHLFGASGNKVVLPAGTNYAAAEWSVEGTPGGEIQVTAQIEGGAKFVKTAGNEVKLVAIPNTTSTPPPPAHAITVNGIAAGNPIGDCTTDTACTWTLTGSTGNLFDGDKLYIIYKIDNAGALKDDGAQVKMTVKLGTVLSDEIMGKKTITVATGKTPIEAFFEETGNTYIKVAVAAESKAFQSNKPATSDPDKEFLNTSEVAFGYLTVLNKAGVNADDGYTDWALGGANAFALNTASTKTNAMLTIKEGGQFAASVTGGKGSVSLRDGSNPSVSIADAKLVTENEATWELTDAQLKSIADYCTINKKLSKCTPIVIKVDGTTIINVPPEDLPKAELTLSYANDNSQKEIKYPGGDSDGTLLTRYRQDGISCWVYNVPSSSAIDELNLRIINDSATSPGGDDCVKGTLYDKEGKLVGTTATALGCPGPNATLYLNSTTGPLATLISGLTGGRGTMLLTSTLAKMEVMAMLRLKSPPCFGNVPGGCSTPNTNPLTNLSTGAHGVACFN